MKIKMPKEGTKIQDKKEHINKSLYKTKKIKIKTNEAIDYGNKKTSAIIAIEMLF